MSILAVGLLASETALEEPHLVTKNVVAESPTAEPEPVLPLTRLDPFELPDVVSTAEVLGVDVEYLDGFRVAVPEVRMTFYELLEGAIKVRGGVNGKRRRHAF
jgi:hypothetical protein